MAILAVSLVTVDLLVSRIAETTYEATLTRELEDKCRMLGIEDISRPQPQRIREIAQAAGGRLTIIDRSGVVIADSENDPSHMENHAGRPEIRAALDGRGGWIRRQSPTMGVTF